jgi:hypothetical protein
MGLGAVGNRAGSFGAFESKSPADAGFRSVSVTGPADHSVTLPAGQSISLTVPSVCHNFGMPTPTGRDKFELMDVEDYSSDVRVRKALRSLATYGTSQGVAQAVMWKVCNDLPFEVMVQRGSKVMNSHEVALASRFVEALDASSSGDLVDPAYVAEGRLYVRILGDASVSSEAARLARQVDGLRVLGLPVRVVDDTEAKSSGYPAMLLNVVLSATQDGQTRGRIVLHQAAGIAGWAPLGKAQFTEPSAPSVLDGPALARALDHAVASAYVSVKVAKRAPGVTTLRVENRLPFTLTKVSLKAGDSAGSPTVDFGGLGVGPARSALVPVEAASAAVDHVEFNGL